MYEKFRHIKDLPKLSPAKSGKFWRSAKIKIPQNITNFGDPRRLSSPKLNEKVAAFCKNKDSRKFIPAKMYTFYLGVYMNSGSDAVAETPGWLSKSLDIPI